MALKTSEMDTNMPKYRNGHDYAFKKYGNKKCECGGRIANANIYSTVCVDCHRRYRKKKNEK